MENGSHYREAESHKGIVDEGDGNIIVVGCCYKFDVIVLVDLKL